MSFLSSFKKLFRFGADDNHQKKGQWNKNIKKDIDPMQFWDIIGELGDGAFGVVKKVSENRNALLVTLVGSLSTCHISKSSSECFHVGSVRCVCLKRSCVLKFVAFLDRYVSIHHTVIYVMIKGWKKESVVCREVK